MDKIIVNQIAEIIDETLENNKQEILEILNKLSSKIKNDILEILHNEGGEKYWNLDGVKQSISILTKKFLW